MIRTGPARRWDLIAALFASRVRKPRVTVGGTNG